MPNSLSNLKKSELEKRLAVLIKRYEGAQAQLRGTLSAADKPVIEDQISHLEEEIQEIEHALTQITGSTVQTDDTYQQDRLQQIDSKLNTLEVLIRQLSVTGRDLAPSPISDDPYKKPQQVGLSSLEEKDWHLLLRRIRDGKCTPFLGSEMSSEVFPSKSEIAQKWAEEFEYPLEDPQNLVEVAQFLAIEYDPMFPKEEWLSQFTDFLLPDFTNPLDPHRILAGLPLPLYITTNYDDFMIQALKTQHKDPRQEICPWNISLKNQPSVFEIEPGFEPTPANPVVFYLHGCNNRGNNKLPESLVLTEDDYFDFLVNISKDPDLIPPRVQRAMAGTSLLFLGYRITDWDFRVLFRILSSYLGRSLSRAHVSVQLVPSEDKFSRTQVEKVQAYLNRYFGKLEIRVYWGTSREFAVELQQRWEAFNRV